MTDHNDSLSALNKHIPLRNKIIETHKSIAEMFPFIVRIAVAIYDPESSLLKTYVHSSGEDDPLHNYQAPLASAPSLKGILEKGRPRVINNMLTFENGQHEHTQRIGRQGYVASYTVPMFNEGVFFGFLFFNADKQDVFTESVLKQIDIYAHMISLMVINELATLQALTAAVKTTGNITHVRDPETGCHLDRMSRYSRLVARELAEKYNLTDSYVEHIFMFSPLHDIGKIGIPDGILLKPDKLNDQERKTMQTHVKKGRKMIDDLLSNFGFKNIEYTDMLRNITEFHHESVNGSGYPTGLKGDTIPLEARIVAVADVFDALTSERSYKEAWSNEKAIKVLKELSGVSLDQDCVNALIQNMNEVEKIQQQFKQNVYE